MIKTEKNVKKYDLGTQGTSINDFFVKYQVGSGNMSIAYFSTEHMISDFFTKYL